METPQELSDATATQDARPAPGKTSRYSWRALLFLALAAGVGGGSVLGWDWLVAAGLSTLIVGLLPCAVLCVAGLCAHRFGQKSQCSDGAVTTATTDANSKQ